MIRFTRTAIAVLLFLLAAWTLVSGVWNFATAVLYQHSGDAVLGFAFLGATAILLVLCTVINPKPQPPKPTTPTMPTIKTLTIPADPAAPVTRDTIDAGLKALQEAVGGNIEAVGSGTDWTAWADEDGKMKRRPFNPRATHAMGFMSGHSLNDPIVGTVVLTGHTPDGEPKDLDPDVADRAAQLSQELTL
jgi:hypothetical protein